VGEKELCGVGIQIGVKKFLGGGDVDFGVFNAEVIAMNNDRGRSEPQQRQQRQAGARRMLRLRMFRQGWLIGGGGMGAVSDDFRDGR
jgi:hypothetical protein